MLTTADGEDPIEAELDGTVDAAGFEVLRDRIETGARQRGPVRLLLTVRHFTGVEPKALVDDLQSLGLAKHIAKYAVVTEIGWLRAAAPAAFAVLPIDGRVFADRGEALAWLQSEAVGGPR